jgi:polyhydroxybutyrate depolymerase
MEGLLPRLRRILVWATAVLLALLLIAAAFTFLMLKHHFPPRPQLSGADSKGTLHHGGRERSYLAYVPASLPAHPALVLVLHGSLGNSEQAREAYGFGFDTLADAEGFIVVYPQGYKGHWNDSRLAGPYAAKRENIDDVGFLRALINGIMHLHGVDPTRVYITGVSNGGQMALRIALEAPDLMRAYAPVVASMPAKGNLACTPSGKPVSILFMNGESDPVNPWNGGDVELWPVLGNRGPVLSAKDSANYFCQLAGLSGEPASLAYPDADPEDGSTVLRQTWTEAGKKPVALYGILGGGHGIPHPQMYGPRLLGNSNRDINAAEEIWNFFRNAP